MAASGPTVDRGSVAPSRPTGFDEAPWVWHGITAGVLGAFLVAVFFLVLDLMRGQPFWTPTVLGSAVFLGESLQAGAEPRPAVVAGYTALHGAVFVAFGLMGAFAVTTAERRRLAPWALGLVWTAVLFLCFEATFLSLAALLADELGDAFRFDLVAAANLLASVGMAGYLVRVAPPRTAASR